ncbi:hypothetical protein Vqi01_34390 [Micromonospora qiuiae]|uniref:TrbL/VirB6 plasmid conjugal transfer protein n=1 Tax=Micromonospora qiuiae TaxID=502268 RepID=A0ABQ4JDW6_9ACTN|nr:hypothetical protein [Micromonospora qiuiae]GIJ28277.1 hypothetical protein Vqi01_34390 [Micromonospora qiuiae]
MVLESTASRFLDELAEQASQAAAEMLKALVTGWLAIPTPEVSQTSGVVQHLRTYTNWAVAAIAVGAVLIAAMKMALERNGREAGSFARNMVALVVLTGAGVPAVQLLIGIGDAYADWILSASANGDLGKRLLLLAPAPATAGLPALVVIGISIMVFLSTMVQLLLLLARNAGLVLLAGLLPVAAAVGGSVRSRYATWLLALVLYKPAAATIYAAVFWLGGESKSLTDLLTGLVMFCMAIVALPALLRLIAPAVSVLSTGGSSGAAVAAVSTAGQLASGAVRLANSGGKSGGGSGGRTGDDGKGRPGGAMPSAPVPPPRPAGGGAASGTGGATAAAGSGAKAGAASAGASSATAGTAAGSGAGAAAAAGPAGIAVAGGVAAAKAGPATVRKIGETGSGAVGGEGS